MGVKLVHKQAPALGKIYGPQAEYDGSAWTGQDGGGRLMNMPAAGPCKNNLSLSITVKH